MQWYEILIIVLAAGFVVGVAAWRIVRRMHGKTGCDECGGCCSHCAGCAACASKNEEKKK